MKTKPHLPLGLEILKIIEKYYKVRDIDHILERFCFSNPLLDDHQCNNLALTDGEGCEYCKNVPENFNCHTTCDISHICHAAYAYRLGIGGEDPNKAVKANSEKSYSELLEEIRSVSNIKKEKGGEIEEEIETSILVEVPEEDEEEISNVVEEKTGELEMSEFKIIDETTEVGEVGRPALPENEELLTCKQVAEVLGCTLMNIYQKIAKGGLIAVGSARKRRVPRSEVERLLAEKERKVQRRKAKEEAQEAFDRERAASKAETA